MQKKISNFFSILTEKAVVYSFLFKGWNAVTALITAPLIIFFFSPVLQGYYYTFLSLIGIQSLIVLGLGQVIQQFVSYEWANLSFGENKRIKGSSNSLKRLAGIKDFALKWYFSFGIIVVIGIGLGGYIFLKYSSANNFDINFSWIAPWFVLCVVQGIQLSISPSLVFLEGCNEVKEVNRLRLIQSVASRISNWIVIVIGGKLWLFSAGILVSIVIQIDFLKSKYGEFFKDLFKVKSGDSINWKKEIFPNQWRYAVNSVAGFVTMSILTPLLFVSKGAVIAGQIGMTWSIITIIWSLAYSILTTKLPQLSIEFARNNLKKMNVVFINSTLISLFILIVGLVMIIVGIYLLNYFGSPIASRFLPPVPSFILAIAIIPNHIRYSVINYVRAMKIEPFWIVGIFETILAAFLIPYLAIKGSIIELTIGYFFIFLFASIASVVIFYKYKKRNT